jgi:hypothetical protein
MAISQKGMVAYKEVSDMSGHLVTKEDKNRARQLKLRRTKAETCKLENMESQQWPWREKFHCTGTET